MNIDIAAPFHQLENFAADAWQEGKNFYSGNSYIIASMTNLVLNTILLSSKLSNRLPPIVPRVANTILGISGAISLNMQGRDWSKHFRDCRFAWHFGEAISFGLTAARVQIKALNILLTVAGGINTLIALSGRLSLHLKVIQIIIPIALIALVGTISGEVIDYTCNYSLLGRIKPIPLQDGGEEKMRHIAQHFIHLAYQPAFEQLAPAITLDPQQATEQRLAIEIVRQMEDWSLDALKAGLAAHQIGKHTVLNGEQFKTVFDGIINTLEECQKGTRENLILIMMGYISMAICRANPYTTLQYSVTWAMSFLYTCQIIGKKYNLYLLTKKVEEG